MKVSKLIFGETLTSNTIPQNATLTSGLTNFKSQGQSIISTAKLKLQKLDEKIPQELLRTVF